MKKILILLFTIFILSSGEKFKGQSQNLNKITLNVTETIDHYSIQIFWLPIQEYDIFLIGHALIKLQDIHTKKVYYISSPNFNVTEEIDNITFDDNGYVLSFKPITIDISAQKIKFFIDFIDIDFDNKKELIIRQFNLYNSYPWIDKVYNFTENGFEENLIISNMNFSSLRGLQFNSANKEIFYTDYFGCCEYDRYYYKLDEHNNFFHYKIESLLSKNVSGIDTVMIKNLPKIKKQKTSRDEYYENK